ncbi:hypothetical protein [Candidatus Poriferisocius sp.]|uniref:hypothetical protein n=1 Tax=Candidatus Poriferisocius sp. TaxID=3101276 RepID=UPI003B01C8A7
MAMVSRYWVAFWAFVHNMLRSALSRQFTDTHDGAGGTGLAAVAQAVNGPVLSGLMAATRNLASVTYLFMPTETAGPFVVVSWRNFLVVPRMLAVSSYFTA